MVVKGIKKENLLKIHFSHFYPALAEAKVFIIYFKNSALKH